jgi:hypothetical protein
LTGLKERWFPNEPGGVVGRDEVVECGGTGTVWTAATGRGTPDGNIGEVSTGNNPSVEGTNKGTSSCGSRFGAFALRSSSTAEAQRLRD